MSVLRCLCGKGTVAICGYIRTDIVRLPVQCVIAAFYNNSSRVLHSCCRREVLHPAAFMDGNHPPFNIWMAFECISKRFRHRNAKTDKTRQSSASEDNDEIDEDVETEEASDDISELHFKEDESFPSNYKELKVHLKSPRLDAIISAGLGVARNQVDNIFYESRLKLNGERVLKKSKQLKVGDYIDLVVPAEAGTTKVKRVRIVQISEERTSGDKLKIFLRAWRSPNPTS